MIKLAQTDDEIADCFSVMQQLRTHLRQEEFVTVVNELMEEKYQLAYMKKGKQVVCVAGFKVTKNLFLGKNLYVEDLASDENHRSVGHGKQMMIWLRQFAVSEGCKTIHLDSGVQRSGAHKFYFSQNMRIACYHFLEDL